MTAEVVELRPAPPDGIPVEQALLGAILLNNDAYYRVADYLAAEHFLEPLHQLVFQRAAELISAGRAATPVTVLPLLGGGADIGGLTLAQYLARLCSEATTVVNAPDYARTVKDLSDRRDLGGLGLWLTALAGTDQASHPTPAIIEAAEERLLALVSLDSSRGGFMRFEDALAGAMDMAAAAYQREGHLSGIPTSLVDLDQLMGGLQKSDLVILAGRPSMGKTSLATNIAYDIAAAYRGKPRPDGSTETVAGGIVGFFSLEMSAEQLATRVLSDQSEVPSSRIRRGDISEADFNRLAAHASDMRSLPLYIEETGGLSILQLIARARRLKRQRGMDLMVVDYIQLLSGTARREFNRVQEVTEITTKLKALAKELNIPILALSQLSREVEKRDNKRPQLSDLRDSGSVEQDADVVLFIFREEYYLRSKEPDPGTDAWFKWEAALKACENRAELIVGKQRHGPCGTVKLAFDGSRTKFSSLAREGQVMRQMGPG